MYTSSNAEFAAATLIAAPKENDVQNCLTVVKLTERSTRNDVLLKAASINAALAHLFPTNVCLPQPMKGSQASRVVSYRSSYSAIERRLW